MSQTRHQAIVGLLVLIAASTACVTDPELVEFAMVAQDRNGSLDEEEAVVTAQDGMLLIDGAFFGGACDSVSGSLFQGDGSLRLEVMGSVKFANCPSGSALYRYTATVRHLRTAEYHVRTLVRVERGNGKFRRARRRGRVRRWLVAGGKEDNGPPTRSRDRSNVVFRTRICLLLL